MRYCSCCSPKETKYFLLGFSLTFLPVKNFNPSRCPAESPGTAPSIICRCVATSSHGGWMNAQISTGCDHWRRIPSYHTIYCRGSGGIYCLVPVTAAPKALWSSPIRRTAVHTWCPHTCVRGHAHTHLLSLRVISGKSVSPLQDTTAYWWKFTASLIAAMLYNYIVLSKKKGNASWAEVTQQM